MSQPTVSAPAAQPASTTIVVRPEEASWRSRAMAWFGWAGCLFFGLTTLGSWFAFQDYFDQTGGITEKYHSGAKFATEKLAIIRIEGMIAEPEGYAKAQIDRIRADQNVRGVVLRIDSPGGTVTASDFLWHHLRKLREQRKIPIVVSMGGIATSGGYYVAMAVGDQPKSIYAEPTTTTGSIGVMFPHYDLSGLLEKIAVRDDTLVTHPRKEMASMTKPMSEEHRQLLQGYITESFGRFKEVVQYGRPALKANPASLDTLATGEIFSANQAKKHGLVDEIGFIEDAIDRAAELAGSTAAKLRVVEFARPAGLIDLGLFAQAAKAPPRALDAAPGLAASILAEFSEPRAYYLSSTLPPLLSSYGRRP